MADVCNQSDCIIKKPTFRNEKYASKRIYHECEGQIEKSVPGDHSLTSLSKPDSNPRDGFFYPPLTPMIDSYNHMHLEGCVAHEFSIF